MSKGGTIQGRRSGLRENCFLSGTVITSCPVYQIPEDRWMDFQPALAISLYMVIGDLGCLHLWLLLPLLALPSIFSVHLFYRVPSTSSPTRH